LAGDELDRVGRDREADAWRRATLLVVASGERGDADALVWIMAGSSIPFLSRTVRPLKLTMPSVTELDSPSGLPGATTISPTCTALESAKTAGEGRLWPPIRTTARSSGTGPDEGRRQALAVAERHPEGGGTGHGAAPCWPLPSGPSW
jgi:hypothetical protein